MAVERTTVNSETTNSMSGLLGLSKGFESFSDDDLAAAVGSTPFAAEIEASGATPQTSMSVTMHATLPGEVVTEGTNGEILDEGSIEWVVPMDGTIVELRAQSQQAPANNAWWARPVSIVALVALIAWVVIMTCFIGYVAWARSRRSRRYRKRPHPTPT